jgi:hypothetical protein
MSKIDGGDIQQRVMLDMDRARNEARAGSGKATATVDIDDILKLLKQMQVDSKAFSAQLLQVDFTATTGQLRDILGSELVKVLQQVPGFVQPQLSQPITPDEINKLLKQFQKLDNNGTLEKFDAIKLAQRPEDARAGLLQAQDSSPVAKNWNSFVQASTNTQGLKDTLPGSKDGVREGQQPNELLAQEIPRREEALVGLRSPTRVGDPFGGLNNKQKLDIMSAGFGKQLAMAFKEMGVRDPSALMRMAATPEGRQELAQKLGLSRGQLTVHVARAEMLTIGPGRHGEQALRPQHLPALQRASIVTQAHLASVNNLPKEQFAEVFASVRQGYSGFAKALTGERPILKKDLQHWAKAASRRKSDLLDADWEDMPRGKGDAEEMIMAWYLQHWAELEGDAKQKKADDEKERAKERLRDADKTGLSMPETKYDPARDDGLICFWIERPNLDWERPTLTEMVYVCLDPKTGSIDMKSKE